MNRITIIIIMTSLMVNQMPLIVVTESLSSNCHVTGNDIHCAHLRNYHSLRNNLRAIKQSRVHNHHNVFRRLQLTNCSIGLLPKSALIDLKFATIILENVSLRQVHRDAFGRGAEYLKRFIYRDKHHSSHLCPQFLTDTEYDLFAALRKCRYLQLLELCIHNAGEVIPSNAFNHSSLRTIRFNGNYSRYSIASNAFSHLKRVKLIIFNKVTIAQVNSHAFNISNIHTDKHKSKLLSDHKTSIIFNNCKFHHDLRKNVHDHFARISNNSSIDLYINPINLVDIESLQVFYDFMNVEQIQMVQNENSLHLSKLDCQSLMDDYRKVILIRQMMKRCSKRMQIKCAKDARFWKSFLENDQNWIEKMLSSEKSPAGSNQTTLINQLDYNQTHNSSLFFMYSMLLRQKQHQQQEIAFHEQSTFYQQTSEQFPKSIKQRWFSDLSYLLELEPFLSPSQNEQTDSISLLLQMIDQTALIVLDDVNSSIERYQLEESNVQSRVTKWKRPSKDDHFVTVSHSKDSVQIIDHHNGSEKVNYKYLVTTWAQFNHDQLNKTTRNDSHLFVGTSLISVNLVESLQNKTQIHDVTIKIRFHNLMYRHMGDRIYCVYWSFAKSEWSTNGCHFISAESTRHETVCQCSHLTNFAALLDISGREDNQATKSLLTYIFCSVSVLCLAISITLSYRLGTKESYNLVNDQFRRRANKHVINVNIAISLLMTNFVTIVGMDRMEIQEVCLSFSIVLSFFLLSSFSFMLLQGYHLLRSIQNPLVSDFKHVNYFALGYGVPICIILASMASIWYRKHSLVDVFIGDFFCWISTKKDPNYIYIIIVPILIAISLNAIFFVLILWNIIGRNCLLSRSNMPNNSTNSHRHLRKDLHKQSLSLVLLIFNFGISWIVFIFYITENGSFFAYLFIVLNGSQGIFFLLNQILILKAKKIPLFKRPINKLSLISTPKSTSCESK